MEGKNYTGSKSLARFILFLLGILCFVIAFIILYAGMTLNPLEFEVFSSYFVKILYFIGVGVAFLWFESILKNSAIQSEKNEKMLIVLNKMQQQLSQLTTQNQKLGKITSVSSNETLKTDAKTEKTNKVEKKVETKQEAPTKKMVKSRLEEIFDSISSSLLSQEKERIVKEVMDLESEALTFSLSLEEQENITDKDLLSNLTASNIEDSPVGNMLSWVKRLAFEYDLPKKALDLAKIAIYYNSSSGFISSAIQLLLAAEKMQKE